MAARALRALARSGRAGPDADVPVEAAGGVEADLDGSGLAARADADSGEVTSWAQAPGGAEVSAAEVKQVTYGPPDGTSVAMFILSPTVEPDRLRPAASMRSPTRAGEARRAKPGTGPECGRTSRTPLMTSTRPATTWSIRAGRRRALLGIHGGSACGHLVGLALTQRPGVDRRSGRR